MANTTISPCLLAIMLLAKYLLGWRYTRYIFLQLYAGLFLRWSMTFTRWLSTQNRQIHQGVVRKSIAIPSRDKGRNIIVHLYQPAGYESIKPRPVLVNWHGSGFVVPSLGTNREFCSLIAARTRCVVLDADHRKAPEYPFPAAHQDAEDIFHYLIANPTQYDLSNIFLSGFSSGGTIALATASTLGPERVKGVIAFYPHVDFTRSHTAPEKHFTAGIIIPPAICDILIASFILPSQPHNDPRISVVLAPTESFPNHVLLVCGNADPWYNSSVEFVERLKNAGHKNAEFLGFEYMAHGFDENAKNGTEGSEKKRQAYAGVVDFIGRSIGASI